MGDYMLGIHYKIVVIKSLVNHIIITACIQDFYTFCLIYSIKTYKSQITKHEEVVLEQQHVEKHLQYLSSARWFYPLRTHRASPSCYPVWFCGVTWWDNQGVHFREILCQYSDTNFDISNTYINISYYNGNYFWMFLFMRYSKNFNVLVKNL